MTVSRGSEPPREQPRPGEDPNPTSVNIAEYERQAKERKTQADEKDADETSTTKRTKR